MLKILRIGSKGSGHRHYVVGGKTTFGFSPDARVIINQPAMRDGLFFYRKGAFKRVDDPVSGVAGPGKTVQAGEVGVTTWLTGRVRIILILVTLAILTASTGLWAVTMQRSAHQDWTPVNIPYQGELGNCRQDRTHSKGVVLRIDGPLPKGALLGLTPGSDGTLDYLEAVLDENVVGKVKLPTGWGEETSIELPPGTRGNLLLRPALTTGRTGMWGVKNISLLVPASNASRGTLDEYSLLTIRNRLKEPGLPPYELARLYRVLCDNAGGHVSAARSEEVNELREIVVLRMSNLLEENLVRVRYLVSSGNLEEARAISTKIRSWVPERWTDGRVRLNEIINR